MRKERGETALMETHNDGKEERKEETWRRGKSQNEKLPEREGSIRSRSYCRTRMSVTSSYR